MQFLLVLTAELSPLPPKIPSKVWGWSAHAVSAQAELSPLPPPQMKALWRGGGGGALMQFLLMQS
jgi:hypothetical protein